MARYRCGTGMYDITGPAAESGMMGYSMVHQKTAGIHMRLRCRAFIIGDSDRRIVFVTADLCMIFQGVTLAVLRRLRERYGDIYTAQNVCLSATHTHAGPGGYSHHALYNLAPLGYDEQHFNAIVDGIVTAIEEAHRRYENCPRCRIRIVEGEVRDCGFNRSPLPYAENPAEERARYSETDPETGEAHEIRTNSTMTLLRFEADDGRPVAMLNWYAVHPTNLGNTNRLISPDNKGYAAYLFEKDMGTRYDVDDDDTFIAGFAQSECGDVSPNHWGYPDGVNDFWRMKVIGKRQYDAARDLFDRAGEKNTRHSAEELEGAIDYRQRYLDMSNIMIEQRWIQNHNPGHGGTVTTCPAAIGLSKLSGSFEDGRGFEAIPEGANYGGVSLPDVIVDRELQKCHAEKSILLVTGKINPVPWTPQILPIQLIRIGQLGIIALPAECSTMAARRLKDAVCRELPGLRHIVLTCYANAYAGYVTTREEYRLQHYEGASVHFGPFTLNAYQQEFSRLASAMHAHAPVTRALQPPDLRDAQKIRQLPVLLDRVPWFKRWGQMDNRIKQRYLRGETVEAVFWGAHPKNDYMTQKSFLYVERRNGNGWEAVAYDWDPETVFKWERHGIASSKITVRWTIPLDTPGGNYRIRHVGYRKGFRERYRRYTGKTSEFSVA